MRFVSKPSRITLVELSIINTSYQKLPFGSAKGRTDMPYEPLLSRRAPSAKTDLPIHRDHTSMTDDQFPPDASHSMNQGRLNSWSVTVYQYLMLPSGGERITCMILDRFPGLDLYYTDPGQYFTTAG